MKVALKKRFVNAIGGMGYVFLILQSVWLISLFMPTFLESDFVRDWLNNQPETSYGLEIDMPDSFQWIMFGIVTVAMLLITIVIAIKAPKKIGQTTIRGVHIAADSSERLVLQRLHVKKKKRPVISSRILMMAKMLLSLVIFLLSLTSLSLNLLLSDNLIVIVSLTLFVATIVFFVAQKLLSLYLKLPHNDVI